MVLAFFVVFLDGTWSVVSSPAVPALADAGFAASFGVHYKLDAD